MTLLGATYPTWSESYAARSQAEETRAVFGLVPQLRAWRLFRRPTQPLPAWTDPEVAAVPADAQIVLSSKLESTIDALPGLVAAMPPERELLWYSYWHECDNWKSPTDTHGDLDPDTWYARWLRLLNLAAAMPPEQRARLRLGPIYTDWAMTHDPNWSARWERVAALPGVDFVGVDTYNIGYNRLRTPEEMFGPALEVARRYGLPLVVTEWGQTDRGDPAECAAMIRRHWEFLTAQPDVPVACWFWNHGNNLASRPVELAEFQRIAEEALMPTYAQLAAEPYWSREVITPAMDWLGDELCRRTGRPRAAAGTKGDNRHLRGAHRSQEWIRRSAYCTNRTYTVQSGLTAEQERHVAGIDFTPGSAEEMVAQCKRIYAAMRAGQLDEVLEFYGNVDGDQVVDGWNNIADRAASSDSSHLWHWHLTIDRRHCNNRQLMERILSIALGDPVEDEIVTPEDMEKIAALTASKVHGQRIGNRAYTFGQVAERTWNYAGEFAAQKLRDEAILAAVRDDADRDAILARVDEQAAQLRADFEARAQADAQRDAELLDLVRQADSGDLDAAEVVRIIGERLAADPAQQG